MSTLIALSKAFQQRTKQEQKEVGNEDQLKPNLITFSGLFVSMWPVTEKLWSFTMVALFITDNEPKTIRQISRLNNQKFTCLCCTLENLHRLSQGPDPLIAW